MYLSLYGGLIKWTNGARPSAPIPNNTFYVNGSQKKSTLVYSEQVETGRLRGSSRSSAFTVIHCSRVEAIVVQQIDELDELARAARLADHGPAKLVKDESHTDTQLSPPTDCAGGVGLG